MTTHPLPFLAHRVASALALLVTSGCASPEWPEPPARCGLERSEPSPRVMRPVQPGEWAKLLVDSNAELGAEAPDHDCSGAALLPPALECGALGSLPAVTLTPEHVVVQRVSFTENLVWVVAQSDGVHGNGPVGWVERTPRGLVVRALGTLYTRLAGVRLRPMAGTPFIVVEGESCEEGRSVACRREAHVLVREGADLRQRALHDEADGACVGDPLVDLAREETRELDGGWRRTFTLAASFEVQGDELVVHEQVVMRDADATLPEVPARPFRLVDGDRILSFHGSRLHTSSAPLWDRATALAGDTARPLGASAGERADREEP